LKVADFKGVKLCRQNYWVLKTDTAVGVNCRNVEGEIRKVWECIQEHTFGGNGMQRKEQQAVQTG